jgi:hypothetical protein
MREKIRAKKKRKNEPDVSKLHAPLREGGSTKTIPTPL